MIDKLKELLGEDVYNEHVAPKIGTDKKYFFGEGEFIPKGRFDEINNQVKDYKDQMKERDTQLAELQKKAKGNEELTNQIASLQEANKLQQEEYQAKLSKQQLDFEIRSALGQTKAKNADVVSKMLNFENIKLVDGKLSGFTDQVEALKASDPYLFEEENAPVPPKRAGTVITPAPTQKQDVTIPAKPWNRHKARF